MPTFALLLADIHHKESPRIVRVHTSVCIIGGGFMLVLSIFIHFCLLF